jgi:cell division septation protein DedD
MGTNDAFAQIFETNNSERMRILANGNVGIGTNNATNRLHVVNNSFNPNGNDLASIKVEGSYGGGITFAEGVNRSLIWSDSGRSLNFSTGGTVAGTPERMRILNNGNVGINTTAPTAILSVNGVANNTTGVWTIFSDARSKENVQDYTRGLSDLMKLRPVTYNYKESMNMGTSTHVSFIAQELQQVIPEMVTNLGTINGMDNFLENNQEGLTYLTIKSIQEMNKNTNGIDGIIQTLNNASTSVEILTNIRNEAPVTAYDYVLARLDTTKNIINDFVAAKVTAIRGYFDEIFTKKIHTETLCVKKSDGTELCVNGDQLQNAINGNTAIVTPTSTATTTSTTTTPVATSTASTTATTTSPIVTPSASTTPVTTPTTTPTTTSAVVPVICVLPLTLDVSSNTCI